MEEKPTTDASGEVRELTKDDFKDMQPWFKSHFVKDIPCANLAMDIWEEQNLPITQRGKPRFLSCPCPRCNPMFLG